MRTRVMLFLTFSIVAVFTLALGKPEEDRMQYTSDFALDDCQRLVPFGGNTYFSLEPGTYHRYEGTIDGEFVEKEVTVLDETRMIAFESAGESKHALTRAIEEREWISGELAEASLNFYARCPLSGNVYYFGEEVNMYAEGDVVSQSGSWVAGEAGAQPGLIMPSLFLMGSRYYHGFAPSVSMDRVEHLAAGLTVETPAGVFEQCVMTVESTPLDPDEECINIHAPGVGLIVDDALRLVEFRVGAPSVTSMR